MKHQLNNVNAIKKTLGVFGVFAGVGLLCAGMTYQENKTMLGASERNAELTTHLVAATQYSSLLRQINNGKVEEAKIILKSALAYNLKEVASLSPDAAPQCQNFAKVIVAEIEREGKPHTDLHLASSQGNIQ
jgi:hypothetical protein